METSLVKEIRTRYTFFGSIALILAAAFTLCFYRAGIGISSVVYVILAAFLIHKTAEKIRSLEAAQAELTAAQHIEDVQAFTLSSEKKGYIYETAAVLLAVSNFLTASMFLHIFSIIGILLLLEFNFLCLVIPMNESRKNDLLQLIDLYLLPLFSIAQLASPFQDTGAFFQKSKFLRNERTRQILLGVLIAVPLLLIVTALLSSADLIFSEMTGKFLDRIFSSADPFLIPLLTVLIFLFCYCIMCAAGFMAEKEMQPKPYRESRQLIATAITVISCLTLVYFIFCGIQIIYLFFQTGLPDGYTYAEYARRGFFELLAVVVINLFVILVCHKAASNSRPLRVVLLIMASCTYIMIASAAYRMILYIQAYYFTLLRLLVLWFLFVILLWMTGAIVSLFRQKFSLAQYLTLVIAVCYIILAFAHPDYWIAKYNTTYDSTMNYSDVSYLTSLSADAADFILPLMDEPEHYTAVNSGYSDEDISQCFTQYIRRVKNDYKESDLRDFNLSLFLAVHAIETSGN